MRSVSLGGHVSISFVFLFMSDPTVAEVAKEAEEYNLAGNCAFKDKEYEKAIRFYNYVFLSLCRLNELGYPEVSK